MSTMPRKIKQQPYRVRKEKDKVRTAKNRRKRNEILALDQPVHEQIRAKSEKEELAGSTYDNNQHVESTPNYNQHTGSTSDQYKSSGCYNADMNLMKEDYDHMGPGLIGFEIASKLNSTPKAYQTVSTSHEKKRTRGRPSKYHIEWEKDNGTPKEPNPNVVQCCLCFRNLLFGCNGQKVFKRHKHFEKDNVICSSCEKTSDVDSLAQKTKPSQNTYEKLEQLNESMPGSIKPVTKVVYIVRPPSEHDKLIVKKPRVYKKRRTPSKLPNNDNFEPTSFDFTGVGGLGGEASSSYRNTYNSNHSSPTTMHIGQSQYKLRFDTHSNYNEDDDDSNEEEEDEHDDCDERVENHSSGKMYVKIGKRVKSGKSCLISQSSAALRKHQDMACDISDQEFDNYPGNEIKSEPVDPEFDLLHSNSQHQTNPETDVKIESVDSEYERFSHQAYVNHGSLAEQSAQSQFVNEDNAGMTGNIDHAFEVSEKDPCSREHSHQTDINRESVKEQPSQSQNLAYIYLSKEEDTPVPKPVPEVKNYDSPDHCVAVIPVLDTEVYVKKEIDSD
ncbi:uncharacterized protein LOC132553112 [Ylistrum balloti]|uniref:uncharacterized protein LOC132553112 n=1 Tax=Ylistrum balloti TaxID=509963 RepID=UPI002905B9BD|nr:uncharacterized protein LOC132553112 [Ylistrum balloti]XP_060073317.1 uncharacterized protein LOC132553112 [Ylistrum balloti]